MKHKTVRATKSRPARVVLWRSLTLGVSLALVALCLGPIPVARAANIPVSTYEDELNEDGDCSLREAIQAANKDSAVDACPAGSGHDTILLLDGTYTLALAGTDEDGNATGDLDILDDLTLQGHTPATTILDGNDLDRLLHIGEGVTVTINGLMVTNGQTPDATDEARNINGGGIYNAGTLILNDVHVGESRTGKGGYYYTPGRGGGIFNEGTLTLNDCVVRGNTAGDGYDGPPGNGGRGGSGGGIGNVGDLTLNDSEVLLNTSGQGGAGSHGGDGGRGGGIYSEGGSVVLNNSQVVLNLAGDGYDSTGTGLTGGSGGDGGGIGCYRGELTLTDSQVGYNSSGDGGDGGPGGPGGWGGHGGGLYKDWLCDLTLNSSTVNGNTTANGGGGSTQGVRGRGGGIWGDMGTMALTNSTINNNKAGDGGGAYLNDAEVAYVLSYCTVAGNNGEQGGGLFQGEGTPTRIMNTIIADNTATVAASPDCQGSFTSGGYNLIEDVTGCGLVPALTDRVGIDPRLDHLADNGGPTVTQALLPGSPAINQIPPGTNGCQAGTSTDQRGFVRAGGGPGVGGQTCDMGAYEWDTGPAVRFGEEGYSAGEGAGSVEISVVLVPAWDETVTVDYATSDGTARAGQDYAATDGTLTFEPGKVEHTFTVVILDDTDEEEDETVTLDLSDATNAGVGIPGSVTLTIVDDDGAQPIYLPLVVRAH